MENIKHQEAAEPEEKSFFKVIVHSFFIIPFLIAVFCALLFAGMHLLTRENRSAYDYLEDVKTGGLTKRWQGAFELSKILANPKLLPDEERFYNELTSAYRQSLHDDVRVRQYLALAMGRTEKPIFFNVLTENIADEKEENLYTVIYALGMLKDTRATDVLIKFLDHQDSRIRSLTVVALGNLSDPNSIESIKKLLYDSEANVQWGAAISLASMNDTSGKETILKLLNRNYLSSFPEVDTQEQTQLILKTIEVSDVFISDPIVAQALQELSQNDPNMNIRSAALAKLKK